MIIDLDSIYEEMEMSVKQITGEKVENPNICLTWTGSAAGLCEAVRLDVGRVIEEKRTVRSNHKVIAPYYIYGRNFSDGLGWVYLTLYNKGEQNDLYALVDNDGYIHEIKSKKPKNVTVYGLDILKNYLVQ